MYKNKTKTQRRRNEVRQPRGNCYESDAVPGSYIALMLFSGRSGISRTLVLESIVSWLVVETVFPVIR